MGGTGELEGGNMRVSDEDRRRVTEELRAHCVEGRITVEELERRTEHAMRARTVHALAELLVDLPRLSGARARPERGNAGSPGPPGTRAFTRRIVVPAGRERTRTTALDTLAPTLNRGNFELRHQTSTSLEFERTDRPAGALVAAVLFFPVGLLALLVRHEERVVISFEDHGPGETMMIIHGRASRRVRRAFAELSF